jgi:hypothetical protein
MIFQKRRVNNGCLHELIDGLPKTDRQGNGGGTVAVAYVLGCESHLSLDF